MRPPIRYLNAFAILGVVEGNNKLVYNFFQGTTSFIDRLNILNNFLKLNTSSNLNWEYFLQIIVELQKLSNSVDPKKIIKKKVLLWVIKSHFWTTHHSHRQIYYWFFVSLLRKYFWPNIYLLTKILKLEKESESNIFQVVFVGHVNLWHHLLSDHSSCQCW